MNLVAAPNDWRFIPLCTYGVGILCDEALIYGSYGVGGEN